MTTTIFATIVAAPEHIHAVKHALDHVARLSRAEPGCLRYDVFCLEDFAGTFYLLETYTDPAALASHHASAHFIALEAELMGKLTQEIRIEHLTSLP